MDSFRHTLYASRFESAGPQVNKVIQHKKRRVTPDGTVRIGTVAALPSVLRDLGVAPTEVLTEAGLDLKLFDDSDNVISYACRGHLIDVCVAKTGCHHFGLLLGQQGGLSSLGLIGYLVQHSPDVESALRNLRCYFHLHVQGAEVILMQEDRLAFLGYSVHQTGVEATAQINDGANALAFNIMRKLCGRNWAPTEVCFSHRKPIDLEPFNKFFRAPLRFDCKQNGLHYHVKWLQQPVQQADPELRRLLLKQINKLESEYRDDFPDQVRRVLSTALLTGHAKEDEIAALFSMHSRTLHRRLKACNTSFRQIVEETRFETARQMLKDSEIGLEQIAEALNYADSRAFTRAFTRWSGATPARWRIDH